MISFTSHTRRQPAVKLSSIYVCYLCISVYLDRIKPPKSQWVWNYHYYFYFLPPNPILSFCLKPTFSPLGPSPPQAPLGPRSPWKRISWRVRESQRDKMHQTSLTESPSIDRQSSCFPLRLDHCAWALIHTHAHTPSEHEQPCVASSKQQQKWRRTDNWCSDNNDK